MIGNSKDRVSLSALLRSKKVPLTWAQTFGWSRDWWINQENGQCAEVQPMPTRADVEEMLK